MAVINSQFKFAHLDNRGERELPPPTEWVLPNPPPPEGGCGGPTFGVQCWVQKKIVASRQKKGPQKRKIPRDTHSVDPCPSHVQTYPANPSLPPPRGPTFRKSLAGVRRSPQIRRKQQAFSFSFLRPQGGRGPPTRPAQCGSPVRLSKDRRLEAQEIF